MKKDMGWKDLDFGDSVAGGTAKDFKTGDWRSEKPVFDKEKCINCYFCWAYCPDSAIILDKDNKVAGINYDFCKGCGICAHECPTTKKGKALTMEPERK
jgi:pyruvate ferredoxin oxidoreductase delta subunit